MKLTNIEMESIIEILKPLLPHRDKVGYVAARNVRTLNTELTEYMQFKNELLQKFGEVDLDGDGNPTGTISLKLDSPNFGEFEKEFMTIRDIENEVELMTIKYDEVVGVLTGTEVLQLEFMLED